MGKIILVHFGIKKKIFFVYFAVQPFSFFLLVFWVYMRVVFVVCVIVYVTVKITLRSLSVDWSKALTTRVS